MSPDCERALLHFDCELNSTESAWLNQHLDACADCRAEQALRDRLRSGLRRAAREPVNAAALERAIRAEVTAPPFLTRWQWAAAAAVFLAIGAYWAVPWTANRMSETAYFRALPQSVSPIMRVGLSDHVHCAAFRKWPATPAPLADVTANLPAEYRPVATAVQARAQQGCQVLLAHQCNAQGRGFIHLAIRTETGKLVSLVMTPKRAGETFQASAVRQILTAGRLPIFAEDVPGYQIAGFETPDFLVYIVSDLPAEENRQLAFRLAEPVEAALRNRG